MSSTSIEGMPETSLTEKIVPVKLFEILNSCPAEPSKLSVPLVFVYTFSVIVEELPALAAVNAILGSAVCPLFGVITIFLSANAIVLDPKNCYLIFMQGTSALKSKSPAKCIKVLSYFVCG